MIDGALNEGHFNFQFLQPAMSGVGLWEALKGLWWWQSSLFGGSPLEFTRWRTLNGGVKLELQETINGNRAAPLASCL